MQKTSGQWLKKRNDAARARYSERIERSSTQLTNFAQVGKLPIGLVYTAEIVGTAWKTAQCEQCRRHFSYKVARTELAQGKSYFFGRISGAEAAEGKASEQLSEALAAAAEPVACPQCGWYQKQMVHLLKLRAARRVAAPGVVAVPLAVVFGYSLDASGESSNLLAYSIVLGVVWLAFVVAAYLLRSPNRAYRNNTGALERASASAAVLNSQIEEENGAASSLLQSEFFETLRLAMLLMAGIDGRIGTEEIEAVAAAYERATGEHAERSKLKTAAERLSGLGDLVLSKLGDLAPHLEFAGKAMIVQSLIEISAADGVLAEQERELLEQCCSALALKAREVAQLLDEQRFAASFLEKHPYSSLR